jgi:hypothetical protein
LVEAHRHAQGWDALIILGGHIGAQGGGGGSCRWSRDGQAEQGLAQARSWRGSPRNMLGACASPAVKAKSSQRRPLARDPIVQGAISHTKTS